MKTIKLYDENSFLKEFSAIVLSCEKAESGYKIMLDKTAFFSEGGGQPSDIGTLDNIPVFDVKEENGEIYHYAKNPLAVGNTVSGKIDFERRFRFMQNHSGEHIVSGVVYKNFGLDNVSFHLSESFVTVDFNGELSKEQVLLIEKLSNKAVFENREIRAYYPEKSELEKLSYRSKKEIDGDIRIVEIEGVDVCACCAPHVEKTGQVGLIKLLDTEKMRGGTRIILKCGYYALDDYNIKYDNVYKISNLLSVKQEEAFSGVTNLNEKLFAEKTANKELKGRIIGMIVAGKNKEDVFFYEPSFDMRELQMLSDSLHKTHGGIKAVFSGSDGALNFAICGEETPLGELFARFKAEFPVRGGGRGTMVQGSVCAKAEDIEKFFKG